MTASPRGRLLIIGAGYLGAEIGRRALEDGRRVIATTTRAERLDELRRRGFEALLLDLTRPLAADALPAAEDAIVCVAPASGAAGYDALYRRGLSALSAAWAAHPPRRLVMVSSIGVYDVRDGRWIDEQTDPDAVSDRQRSLLDGESALRRPPLNAVTLRLGGLYGPGRAPLIDRINLSLPIEGQGNFANNIRVEDAARAALFLLERGRPGDVYLGVDSEPARRETIARWLADQMRAAAPAVAPAGEGRRAQSKRCSNRKIVALGFTFLYPTYRDGYASMLDGLAPASRERRGRRTHRPEEVVMENAKILIIDDEETVCAAMRELLELKGYTVFEANNGVSGLKICAESNIDLIVLDLNMPRMDGYLFMERLLERWETDHRKFKLPQILVLTAVDKNTDLGLAKNLGASKFMNKPFRSNEFLASVKELLG